ncbi:MBL fold metallo-hydrolase, partial [Thermodesulfobacteriota bacterium]
VLRRKVDGIHWEEALEQLHGSPDLKGLNSAMKVDKIVKGTVRKTKMLLQSTVDEEAEPLGDSFSFFVSWNLETNQPKLTVDITAPFMEALWIA